MNNILELLVGLLILFLLYVFISKCNPEEEYPYQLIEVQYVDFNNPCDTLKILLNTKEVDNEFNVLSQEWIDPKQHIKELKIINYGHET